MSLVLGISHPFKPAINSVSLWLIRAGALIKHTIVYSLYIGANVAPICNSYSARGKSFFEGLVHVK